MIKLIIKNHKNAMGLLLQGVQRYTYQDYRNWPGDVRYELIAGEPYLMSPAPDLAHQDVAGDVYFQLMQVLRNKPCRPFIAPIDVRFPKNNEDDEFIDTVVQPDVLVVCDKNKLDKRGIRGAPDWILEVLSPSTASHDQIKKLKLYEQQGVLEYWLIHPIDRLLTIYKLNNAEYGKATIVELKGSTDIETLPGVTIHWDELVLRLPKDN